jgi:hypothetical protein
MAEMIGTLILARAVGDHSLILAAKSRRGRDDNVGAPFQKVGHPLRGACVVPRMPQDRCCANDQE